MSGQQTDEPQNQPSGPVTREEWASVMNRARSPAAQSQAGGNGPADGSGKGDEDEEDNSGLEEDESGQQPQAPKRLDEPQNQPKAKRGPEMNKAGVPSFSIFRAQTAPGQQTDEPQNQPSGPVTREEWASVMNRARSPAAQSQAGGNGPADGSGKGDEDEEDNSGLEEDESGQQPQAPKRQPKPLSLYFLLFFISALIDVIIPSIGIVVLTMPLSFALALIFKILAYFFLPRAKDWKAQMKEFWVPAGADSFLDILPGNIAIVAFAFFRDHKEKILKVASFAAKFMGPEAKAAVALANKVSQAIDQAEGNGGQAQGSGSGGGQLRQSRLAGSGNVPRVVRGAGNRQGKDSDGGNKKTSDAPTSKEVQGREQHPADQMKKAA